MASVIGADNADAVLGVLFLHAEQTNSSKQPTGWNANH